MDDTGASRELADFDRVYLETARLATNVLLRMGEEPGIIADTLQTELFILRDRVEFALLLPEAASSLLPWHKLAGTDLAGTDGETRPGPD